MKIRYYLLALLLPFATLMTHAAITGVSPMTTLNTMVTTVTRAGEATLALQGPGLGNRYALLQRQFRLLKNGLG